MKELFENEKVLCQITGRLVPSNRSYPDAVCNVVITERFLDVVEDNFDGSYTRHFSIPLEKVVTVEKYTESRARDGQELNALSQILGVTFSIFGFLEFSNKSGKEIKKPYLMIEFINQANKSEYVFFEDCSSINNMVKTFNKCKPMGKNYS